MQRVAKVHVKHPDGSEQDIQQISADDPHHLMNFICGITDEQPGTEFVFTIVSTGDRFPTRTAPA